MDSWRPNDPEGNRRVITVAPGSEKADLVDIGATGLGLQDPDLLEGRGVLLVDTDRDGRQDFLLLRYQHPPSLFRSLPTEEERRTGGNAWVSVRVWECCSGCRESVGARVAAYVAQAGETERWELVHSAQVGTATGFLAYSDTAVHIGLGRSGAAPVRVRLEVSASSLNILARSSGVKPPIFLDPCCMHRNTHHLATVLGTWLRHPLPCVGAQVSWPRKRASSSDTMREYSHIRLNTELWVCAESARPRYVSPSAPILRNTSDDVAASSMNASDGKPEADPTRVGNPNADSTPTQRDKAAVNTTAASIPHLTKPSLPQSTVVRRLAQRAARRIWRLLSGNATTVNGTANRSLPLGIVQGRQDRQRTASGRGNNRLHPTWGMADSTLKRLVPAAYSDGVSAPSSPKRPSARLISNMLYARADEGIAAATSRPSPRGLSDMMVHWGQFIAHDLSHTTPQPNVVPRENFPIRVPRGDPAFDINATGVAVIRMRRSIYRMVERQREQINKVSSYLDGSTIYGSDPQRLKALRLGRGGRLQGRKGTQSQSRCPHALRRNTLGLANDNPLARPIASLSLSGDARANIQPGLHALHTLWHREHNMWADVIAQELGAHGALDGNTEVDVDSDGVFVDELLFTEARQLVEAEMQIITYDEYLPALLGRDVFGDEGLLAYSGYDETVDAAISTEFSTAAFRLLHSQVNEAMLACELHGSENGTNQHNNMGGSYPPSESQSFSGTAGACGPRRTPRLLPLEDSYFLADMGDTDTTIDALLVGMTAMPAQALDLVLVPSIRNNLFGRRMGGVDLGAIGIQRGRDHGLPDYHQLRTQLGLSGPMSLPQAVTDAYEASGDVGVDAIVGMYVEMDRGTENGERVGELAETIILDQFSRVRDGDRFHYRNTDGTGGSLQPEDIVDLRNHTTLAAVMRRNIVSVDWKDPPSTPTAPKSGVMYVSEVL